MVLKLCLGLQQQQESKFIQQDYQSGIIYQTLFHFMLLKDSCQVFDYMFGLTDNHSNRGVELYSSYYDMFKSFSERGDRNYFIGAWSIPITLFIFIQNQFCARAGQSLLELNAIMIRKYNVFQQQIFQVAFFVGYLVVHLLELKQINGPPFLMHFLYFSFMEFLVKFSWIYRSILLYMIINIPPWHYYVNLYRTQRKLILFYIFCIDWVCVNYGAIQSTLIGSMHALIIFVQKMSFLSAEVMTNQKEAVYQINVRDTNLHEFEEECNDIPPNLEGTFTVYRFNGALNYINIKGHIDQIKELAKTDIFIISFRYVCIFDCQEVDSLAIIIDNMRKNSTQVYITGLHPEMLEQLSENNIFKEYFINENHIFIKQINYLINECYYKDNNCVNKD